MASATTLVINILADAADAQKALKQTEDSVGGLGESTRSMGKIIAAGAAAGVAGIVALGVEAFNAAEESARIARETERVLKTTGAAAWISAGQVSELAGAISDKTGADDEAIQSGANLILTFAKVQNVVGEGNNIFDRATEAALDMSTALGTDMSGASIQLGKALNDPIKGLTALSKAGVSFTQDQKDQIKVLQESGDVLGAQKIILGEVEKEFKGAAEAAGTPLDKLKVAIGNLQEDIGAKLIPPVSAVATLMLNTMGPAIEKVTQFFEQHGEAVKFLATVALTGLAAAQVPVIAGFVVLQAQAVGGFFTKIAQDVIYMGEAFLTVAAQQGVLTASTQALNFALSSAGPIIAVVALAGAIYGVVSALTATSEAQEKFIQQTKAEVPTGSFKAMDAALASLRQRWKDVSQDHQRNLQDWRNTAAAVADVLIPFHDVDNSMADQQAALRTLKQGNEEYSEALNKAKNALFTYAQSSVLAANGIQEQANADFAATGKNKALGEQIDKTNEALKQIAESKGIDPVQPGAIDRITALYERTKITAATTLEMSDAQEKFNDAASDAKDKVDAYKASLDALTGAHLSAAQAETNYSSNSLALIGTLNKNKEAIRGMADQTDASAASSLEHAGIINTNNKAIQDNVKSALDLANATFKEQQERVGSTKALEIATSGLNQHRDQLIAVMVQMGYTDVQAAAYIDRLGLTPKNINTQMNLDNHQANQALTDTQYKLDKASGKYVATLDADTTPAEQAISRLLNLYKGAVNEARERALAGTRAIVPSSPGAVVPMPQPVGRAATTAAPTFSITINSTGLGADSPKIQRDIVGALTRWTQREGALRVPVSS